MRHLIHRVRFHVGTGTRSSTGSWAPTLTPAAEAVPAFVTSPRTDEGDVSDPVSAAAFVPAATECDLDWVVEILDHPIHSGLYRVTSLAGGRHVRRLGLTRNRRGDGSHGIQ